VCALVGMPIECFVSFHAHDLVTITNTIMEAMAAINGNCLMRKQKPKQNYNGI